MQKSRLESLGELSAGLAHEINQPLSVISLIMENVNYKMQSDTATKEYLVGKFENIYNNINKIKQLIDHVRIFSRDQGNVIFDKIDVNNVIHAALSMIGIQIKNHQIDLKTELSPDLGYTLGNPSRLEQVLLNLLSNSKDAIMQKEDNGNIAKKEILIRTFRENKRITINVTDSGTGIPKENLEKIFNPFFTTKSAGRGTGLGMAIVYGIVTEMKGEIRIESEDMKYTSVTIDLPGY
jgi:signal transduction histidine kinase